MPYSRNKTTYHSENPHFSRNQPRSSVPIASAQASGGRGPAGPPGPGGGISSVNTDEGPDVVLAYGDVGAVRGEPLIYQTFTGRPDASALNQTDSGQTWIKTGSQVPAIRNGMLTFGTTTLSSSIMASYAMISVDSPPVRIGGTFRFDPSNSAAGNVTLGLFSSQTIPSNAPAHLSITPTSAQFSVASVVSGTTTFTTLGADNAPDVSGIQFAKELLCDGATEYTVEIELDFSRGVAIVYLPTGAVASFTDSRIKTLGVSATYPFWETFTQSTTDAIGGFTSIWCDDQRSSEFAPVLEPYVGGLAARPKNGASTIYARPSAVGRDGQTWYDRTSHKLAVSDGSHWVDFVAGIYSGNMLQLNQSVSFTDPATQFAVVNCTASRSTAVKPAKRAASLKITATTTPAIQAATQNSFAVVSPSMSYSALVNSVAAATTARPCYAQISWYTSGGAYISSSTGTPTPSGANGAFLPTTVVTATSPANAAGAAVALVFLEVAASNEVFYASELCLAPGTITGFIEV